MKKHKRFLIFYVFWVTGIVFVLNTAESSAINTSQLQKETQQVKRCDKSKSTKAIKKTNRPCRKA